MKYLKVFLLLSLTVGLAGCQTTDTTPESESVNSSEATVATSMSEMPEDASKESESEFAEVQIFNELVGENLGTETDNPNKRVLFFVDGSGHKQYKSVYIKNTQRLKIIDLEGDSVLFNETIE